uniref:Uncharacterized protein n=1 Tax=Anopheles albimanus TaxID=7167 RepID=A0A182FXW3_ANOAL
MAKFSCRFHLAFGAPVGELRKNGFYG